MLYVFVKGVILKLFESINGFVKFIIFVMVVVCSLILEESILKWVFMICMDFFWN